MLDLHNPEHASQIVALLKAEVSNDFWQILVQALQENITDVEQRLEAEDLSGKDPVTYKHVMEMLRLRKKYLLKLVQLPDTVMSYLDMPEETLDSFDAYDDPTPVQELM